MQGRSFSFRMPWMDMGNSGSSTPSIYERSRSHYHPAPSIRANGPPRYSMNSRYSVIHDNYKSLDEVQRALRDNGLESSNLIVGIDFTKSNEWTGRTSLGGRSLHAIGHEQNPYEKAISVVGTTLSPFDEDNLIPCFGFGDSTTHDKHVFSFFADHRPCDGMEEALARYRTIAPHVRLAGPTSFAPIINKAVDIVEESGGQYHVLVIIADGQIEGPQERATVDAIVNASYYPLSIVLVGVGDGPFDMMKQFDDNLPNRVFDNFQFVNFTEIMQSCLPQQQKEAKFALAALMEIPLQFNATVNLGLLGVKRGQSPGFRSLPPPPWVLQMDGQAYDPRAGAPPQSQSFSRMDSQNNGRPSHSQSPPSYHGGYYSQPAPNYHGHYGGYPPYAPPVYPPSNARYPSAPPSVYSFNSSETPDAEDMECPVCLLEKKDMAFNCGHQTCEQCAQSLTHCPICRQPVTTRIRLY